MSNHLFSNLPEETRAAAAELARRGFAVFPCRPENSPGRKDIKAPLTPHGFKDASSDADVVAAMFNAVTPAALIGLPTGLINGVVVVDIESTEGHGVDGCADAAAYEAEGFCLTDTVVCVRTWSGGYHLYYRSPNTERKSFKFKRKGIEVRGDGGYVICPPSRLVTGQKWEVIQ